MTAINVQQVVCITTRCRGKPIACSCAVWHAINFIMCPVWLPLTCSTLKLPSTTRTRCSAYTMTQQYGLSWSTACWHLRQRHVPRYKVMHEAVRHMTATSAADITLLHQPCRCTPTFCCQLPGALHDQQLRRCWLPVLPQQPHNHRSHAGAQSCRHHTAASHGIMPTCRSPGYGYPVAGVGVQCVRVGQQRLCCAGWWLAGHSQLP